MKKKILCFSIALLLILPFCFLSGCKGDNGKIKIKVGMWPMDTQKQDVAMYTQWKKDFEEVYPQYEIVPTPYTYNPSTFVQDAIGNTLPTIFQTYFTEPQFLISQKYVREITPQVKELGWYDKMDPSMRKTLSSGDKLYGIPRDGYGMGLILNLNLLYQIDVIGKDENGYILYDENGDPLYPTTFEEIYDISKLIKENIDNGYGIVLLSANKNGGWQFANMAWNFSGERLQIENPDGTVTANLNNEGAIRAMEWMQKMKNEDLIVPGTSLSYNDWYQKIGSKTVAMAFTGSDAISLPVTNYDFNKDDLAFVPMPTGDGEHYYSLYGGTPYCFSHSATDEQVMGALKFLEFIGRSPETSEISINAMRKGHQVAQSKGMPILPTIKPWINEDYLEAANALEQEYINVNLDYYNDFFNTIKNVKRDEEPYSAQKMYEILDNKIQELFSKPSTSNVRSLLNSANSEFQKVLDRM